MTRIARKFRFPFTDVLGNLRLAFSVTKEFGERYGLTDAAAVLAS